MTLNLIIPVYNDYQGLIKTLASLNLYDFKDNFHITVVNDCSTDGEDYTKVIDIFSMFYDIQVLSTPENSGPGVARQYGLEHVKSEADYITFIDAGDIVYSSTELKQYLKIIEQYPDANVFSPAHHIEEEDGSTKYESPFNNRLHGKIYKTSFLKEYDIRFCESGSRMNEDIGFNALCRYICNYLKQQDPSKDFFIHYETPIILWTYDANSITRTDEHAFYYKQNVGLAANMNHAVNKALELGIPYELIQQDIYETFVHLYVFYISTLNIRPEFLQETFDGTYSFYKNNIIIAPIDEEKLTNAYNIVNSHYAARQGDPFTCRIPAVSFMDLLMKLEQTYQDEQKKMAFNALQNRFNN